MKNFTLKKTLVFFIIIVMLNSGFLQAQTLTRGPYLQAGKQIQLQLDGVDKGIYTLKVYSNIGQLLTSKTIEHGGGSATETIALGSVAKGSYQLQITGSNTTVTKTILID